MDVHFIPFNGRPLIYCPLKRLAFIGNRALIECLRGRATNPNSTPAQTHIESVTSSRNNLPGRPLAAKGDKRATASSHCAFI